MRQTQTTTSTAGTTIPVQCDKIGEPEGAQEGGSRPTAQIDAQVSQTAAYKSTCSLI